MREKLHCKHGEFDPLQGCPQCIEEARRERAASRNIVKVQYLNEAGEPTGREYTYFAEEELALGDVVQVPVTTRNAEFPAEHSIKAAVVAVNVPETEIAAFRDKVKTIPSGSKRPPTQAEDFIPETEIEFEATETPPVAQVARLFNPDDIKGRLECDEEASAEAGTLVGEIKPNPDFIPDDPRDTDRLAEAVAAAEEGAERPWEIANEREKPTTEYPPALTIIEHKFGPPAASDLFNLYRQAAGLLDFAKTRVISTNEDLKPATDDLAVILNCKKAMETRKAEIVGPMRSELDKFYQAFNELMAPILEAEKLTKGKVSAFEGEQRRKAAEARRIEDEKARLARDEAALSGTGEITVPLGTAQAPPPVPERTRTEMGTLSGRANWKARVVDFAALPDEYKLPDMQTLNAKAKASKGTAIIPGVEFYDDRIVQVRTKTSE